MSTPISYRNGVKVYRSPYNRKKISRCESKESDMVKISNVTHEHLELKTKKQILNDERWLKKSRNPRKSKNSSTLGQQSYLRSGILSTKNGSPKYISKFSRSPIYSRNQTRFTRFNARDKFRVPKSSAKSRVTSSSKKKDYFQNSTCELTEPKTRVSSAISKSTGSKYKKPPRSASKDQIENSFTIDQFAELTKRILTHRDPNIIKQNTKIVAKEKKSHIESLIKFRRIKNNSNNQKRLARKSLFEVSPKINGNFFRKLNNKKLRNSSSTKHDLKTSLDFSEEVKKYLSRSPVSSNENLNTYYRKNLQKNPKVIFLAYLEKKTNF